MPEEARSLRVVVCGAVFGQVYLEAFRQTKYPIVLAGILARGSLRSQACAQYYGVPLFTSIDQIPEDVTAACVVVRSRILGGKGTELAHELMRRGLHVLQEHPVHPEEMSESLRLSRAHGVIYRLNSFYVHIGPVRRFIGAVKELQRSHKPLFIDAACGCQLSYSLLDVLSQSLGSLRPWNLEVMPHRKGEIFTTIKAIFCGVPATLRIQNQLDPADPDGFSHLLHRIDFGYAPGTLSLAETHGPLIWAPRPQFPHEVRAPDAKPQFSYPVIEKPRVTLIGPVDQPSFEEIFRDVWPQGVTRALLEFRRAIMGHENSLHIAQQQLTVSQLWKEMLEKIGPPELVHGDSVANLPKERLAAMDRSAREMERMP